MQCFMTLKWYLTLFEMFNDLKVTFDFVCKILRPYSDIRKFEILLTEDFYEVQLIWRFLRGYVRHYTQATIVAHIPWISHYLPNTVIIVTYFNRVQHRVFVIAIVTGECAILIQRKLRFRVCHSCYCLLIYNDSVISL